MSRWRCWHWGIFYSMDHFMDIVRTHCIKMGWYCGKYLYVFDAFTFERKQMPFSLTGFTIPQNQPSLRAHPTRAMLLWAGQGRRPNDAEEAQRQDLNEGGSRKQRPKAWAHFLFMMIYMSLTKMRPYGENIKFKNHEVTSFNWSEKLWFRNEVFLLHVRLSYSLYHLCHGWDFSAIEINPWPLDIPAVAAGRKAGPVLTDHRGYAAWQLTDTP